MPTKRKKGKLDLLTVAMWGAGLTTLIAIFGTAFLAIDDSEFAEFVQRITLMVMLVSYLFFIGVVISRKKQNVEPFLLNDDTEVVKVLPSKANQFFIVEREMMEWYETEANKSPAKIVQNRNVRVVVARGLNITSKFTELLDWFPDLSILDVQDSTVSDDVWESLLGFEHLQHVFIANAVPPQKLGIVGMTLPDVRLWTEPRQLVAADNLL